MTCDHGRADRYYACWLIPETGRCWYASVPYLETVSPWRRKPMMTTAPRTEHDHTPAAVLWMACELRDNTWTLGCSLGHGQKPRARRLPAHAQQRWLDEIAHAKARLGLPNTAPVARCDAGGREGGWPHCWLQARDVTPQVVDASSIAVPRRQRRAKSDALDVRKWLRRLRR